MRLLLAIWMSLFSVSVFGQLKIGTGTIVATSSDTEIATNGSIFNAGNLDLDLNSFLYIEGQGTLSSAKPVTIPNLVMSGIDYNLTGHWNISENLSLLSGTITPDGASQLVVGASGIATSENNAFINGMLYHTGTGEKFYPIGVSGTYAPVTLHSVQGADDLLLGIQTTSGDLGITALPDNVQSASTSWYWQMDVQGTFSGSQVSLPVLAGDEALLVGDNVQPVVLEANGDLSLVNSIGNGLGSDANFVRSRDVAVGPYLLLGSTLILVPVIHNIITPNNDNKNDYLIIDAVDAYADSNEVIILDRWGAEVYRKKNFTNFDDFQNPYDGSFDFLVPGNYICILKYGQEQTVKQTITVLK